MDFFDTMTIDPRVAEILSRGWYRERLTPEDCKYLLTFRDRSPVANLSVSLAERLNHQACADTGQICAVIETSTGPCPLNCGFCRFAESTSSCRFFDIDDSVLAKFANEITGFSDVRSIRLETTGDADIGDLARQVGIVRDNSKRGTRIIVDTKDLDEDGCRMLKDAGAFGAYHSCRIGEGKDTSISPERRLSTIRNLVDAGFWVTAGTEPFGVDTKPDDIVDAFFRTLDIGCHSCEVRPRIPVPGTRFGDFGEMSGSRVAQIRSVLTLASSWYVPRIRIPMMGTYVMGRNVAFAHFNDLKEGKAQIEAARRRLFNAGYRNILRSDDAATELGLAYLRQTGSV
ncbi:hypothetical protein TALC_00159 [Thermoplasmatales archaeon BRNA1]|nr:hypothetical protein TALC_00159 [Thermoplasmatales archaeon BRNA1]